MAGQGISVRRKFDGKNYTYRTLTSKKKKAEEIADTIRGAGKLARVIKSGKVYLVYAG